MKLTVISYLESREWNDSCHCHPEWHHAPSDLAIVQFDTTEEAVTWLAGRLWSNRDHSFWNGVVMKGFSLESYLPIRDPQTYKGASSIEILGEDEEDVFGSELRAKVNEQLTLKEMEEWERKRLEQETFRAISKRAEEARDRLELERLKKKLGE